MVDPSKVIVVPVDVTLVRLRLQGPLTLLASLPLSGVALLWERICSRKETHRATTQQV
jgi:hypothetical protein